jgi:hypothetical protein
MVPEPFFMGVVHGAVLRSISHNALESVPHCGPSCLELVQYGDQEDQTHRQRHQDLRRLLGGRLPAATQRGPDPDPTGQEEQETPEEAEPCQGHH